MRNKIFFQICFFLAVSWCVNAQDKSFTINGNQILGPDCLSSRTPCSQDEHERWLADLNRWRAERRIRVAFLVAVNYSPNKIHVNIPSDAKIVIGTSDIEQAGVVVWT